MKANPPIFSLLLFLEEFTQWVPGGVNTIIERLAMIFLSSVLLFLEKFTQWAIEDTRGAITEDSAAIFFRFVQDFGHQSVTLLNPGVSLLLFLICIGAAVKFAHSLLARWAGTDLILFMKRHREVRNIVAAVIAFWLLQRIFVVLSSADSNRLVDLYQNKALWAVLFIGMAAYRFASPPKEHDDDVLDNRRHLVLIHDGLNDNYRLVTGNSRIAIVESMTVKSDQTTFSKVIDVVLPVIREVPLKLGDVDASLTLEINCSNSIERIIDRRQYQSLELFLGSGSQKIKACIETIVSDVKVFAASMPDKSPSRINQVLVTVFPEIMFRTRKLGDLAAQEPNLPFLTISISHTLNLSSQVDKLVAQDERDRAEIFRNLAVPDLTTPYHPEEELEARFKHVEKLMHILNSSQPLTIENFSSMVQIIDRQHDELTQKFHLEKKQHGFLERLFGSS